MPPLTLQGRPWDSFDAYLFDIDGTLIHCTDAVHYFAFCEALTATAGRPLNLDGVVAHGNVDIGILRDAFQLAGVPESDWRPRLPEMRQAMGRFVQANRADLRADVLPAVPQVLDHLRSRGKTLGIATGNLQAIGQAKLRHAGLLDYFQVGGWSDEYESRAEVFRNAVSLVQRFTHPQVSICVVGDTPIDIQAAHANQLPILAVATGIYTPQQLSPHHPDLLVASLAELLQ